MPRRIGKLPIELDGPHYKLNVLSRYMFTILSCGYQEGGGGGDGGYSPSPLAGSGKQHQGKNKKRKGPFENELGDIRGLFFKRFRLASERCSFCRVLLHVDDQV